METLSEFLRRDAAMWEALKGAPDWQRNGQAERFDAVRIAWGIPPIWKDAIALEEAGKG